MTPQEIFDTVARHLFTQGERAGLQHLDEDGEVYDFECLYRAPGGKTCAVGCLIPDAAYRPSMEGSNPDTLVSMFGDLLPRWMASNADMLADLQAIHDTAVNWKDDTAMKFALGLAADKFGLDKAILYTLSFNRAEV